MAQFYQAIRESGLLTEEQYKQAQSAQTEIRGSTFYSALKRSKLINDEQLVNFSCSFFGFQRIGNAFKANVDFVATNKIMGDVFQAINTHMFVVMLDNKVAFVVNDPENESLLNKATAALGSEPIFVLVTDEEFEIILQYQLTPRAISEQAQQIKVNSTSRLPGERGENESYTQKLLDMLIDSALTRRASDLHLLPLNEQTAQIMLRVDGKLYPYSQIKADILANLRNRLKTMAGTGGDSPDVPVEGQIKVAHHGDQYVDVRINIVKSSLGYDFNLRFIDSSLRGLDELGLSDVNYENYLRLLHMTKGLVIICGPTGSGKTTLLYAGFKKLLAENKAIFTIEDPVEIILPGTTQLLVQKEKGMSYGERFPSALRHDPDVIGIGEIRTLDVAEQTVQAANTGHLVFSTLHTNNAIGAISRLTNLGLDPYSIGDVLAAVVAQRLVRRVCDDCAVEYDLPADSEWRERYQLGAKPIRLRKGCGCANCAGTGYRGRIAVNEFLLTNSEIRGAIQRKATSNELEQILLKNSYKTYLNDAIQKAIKGVTTFEEVDELYRDIV